MRAKNLPTWIAVIAVAAGAAAAGAQQPPELKTDKEKLSYALGLNVGRQLAKLDVAVDAALFARGLNDALFGGPTAMTESQASAAIAAVEAELKRRQWQVRARGGEENEKAGAAFLAENAKKEGVVSLPSGVQYQVLKEGAGRKPTDGDIVDVNYRGTLIDGVEFDSSFRTGKPATMRMTDVIPGWREALRLMPVGSKWRIFVPPQQAYGELGAGGIIGPGATLVYEVELLAVH